MLGLNIDLKLSSYVMGVVGLSDMVGRIMIGRIVDRYFIRTDHRKYERY